MVKHSNQVITLTTINPPEEVQIVGITMDHGLLRTVRTKKGGGGGFIDIQPDLNSFNVMVGLINEKKEIDK
jgi:biotin---protein ligase